MQISETPTPYAIICSGDPDMDYKGCGKVFVNISAWTKHNE